MIVSFSLSLSLFLTLSLFLSLFQFLSFCIFLICFLWFVSGLTDVSRLTTSCLNGRSCCCWWMLDGSGFSNREERANLNFSFYLIWLPFQFIIWSGKTIWIRAFLYSVLTLSLSLSLFVSLSLVSFYYCDIFLSQLNDFYLSIKFSFS